MPDFRIGVEIGSRIPAISPLTAEVFPTLAAAVRRIAEAALEQWRAYANGAPLPGGGTIHNRTGEYARSIQLRQIGPFSAEVYSNLSYADTIEDGGPAYDMKRMLDTSLKVRMSKKGNRYLIIPFRHNAPGSVLGQQMPGSVYEWWKGPSRQASSITLRYLRPAFIHAYDIGTHQRLKELPRQHMWGSVPDWRYQWGTRLTAADLSDMGIDGKESKRLKGMVMFRKPGGTGRGAHTQYITFRTMSDRSRGWIRPKQEGKHPARITAEQLQPVAEEAFARAMEEDLRVILGAS